MLQYVTGDLLTALSQTLVNPVNTVGVMGKGIALQFKKQYPDMFVEYKRLCKAGELNIGELMLWKATDHWILNFPTKKHWRDPSKLDYVKAGLQKFANSYSDYGITSIAFPKLGCGNGGLDWQVVRPVMEQYLKGLPIDVYVYWG